MDFRHQEVSVHGGLFVKRLDADKYFSTRGTIDYQATRKSDRRIDVSIAYRRFPTATQNAEYRFPFKGSFCSIDSRIKVANQEDDMMIEVSGREFTIEGRMLRIARLHGDGYRFVGDPADVIDGLRQCGERVHLFTFAQRLRDAEVRFSYLVEEENAAVLPVTTFENWWTQQIGFKARNKAKQAEKKGVVLREVPFDDTLVAGIREIYNESPLRQRRRFPHYGKDLKTVHREEATFLDSSIFIGAYFEDQLIGFVKLVPDETRTQAGLMNIVSLIKHLDKAPQNALIAYSVRACATRGIRYLVYSKFDYGKERDSLRDFKERNGFQRVDTPRYYVPMTAMGRAAFRLGLHRPLGERIPEPVAAKLRDMRAAWYERRYRSVMEQS